MTAVEIVILSVLGVVFAAAVYVLWSVGWFRRSFREPLAKVWKLYREMVEEEKRHRRERESGERPSVRDDLDHA